MRLVFPGFRIKRLLSETTFPPGPQSSAVFLRSGESEPPPAAAREAGPVHLQQVQPSRMSNTSQKHRDFVGEPMGDKPVTALAGIGEILGKKLEHQGFDKAYVVLGQFLLLKKDGEMFTEWLKDASGANSRQAGLCALCLKEWCDAFL
ncbi:barrier-to-autointegration factor-like protein isoform X2 [Pagrus major]|uniref:barrier-to-autointegration factor-like protein isoform X2 n=1 Tax=Pagrus major TaxID=143350 RepID=UPI003CC87CDE